MPSAEHLGFSKGFHDEAFRVNPDLHPHVRMEHCAEAWSAFKAGGPEPVHENPSSGMEYLILGGLAVLAYLNRSKLQGLLPHLAGPAQTVTSTVGSPNTSGRQAAWDAYVAAHSGNDPRDFMRAQNLATALRGHQVYPNWQNNAVDPSVADLQAYIEACHQIYLDTGVFGQPPNAAALLKSQA